MTRAGKKKVRRSGGFFPFFATSRERIFFRLKVIFDADLPTGGGKEVFKNLLFLWGDPLFKNRFFRGVGGAPRGEKKKAKKKKNPKNPPQTQNCPASSLCPPLPLPFGPPPAATSRGFWGGPPPGQILGGPPTGSGGAVARQAPILPGSLSPRGAPHSVLLGGPPPAYTKRGKLKGDPPDRD